MWLALDVVLNTFADSVHWRLALPAFGDRAAAVGAVLILLAFVIVRIAAAASLVVLLVSTAHYKLGRHHELWQAFGSVLVVHLCSFVPLLVLCIIRLIREVSADTRYPGKADVTYWHGDNGGGDFFSALSAFHMCLTLMYYVKTVSAFRRLASTEFYLHPILHDRQGLEANEAH